MLCPQIFDFSPKDRVVGVLNSKDPDSRAELR